MLVTPNSVTEAVTTTDDVEAVVVASPDEFVVEVVGETVPPVAVQVTKAFGIALDALSVTVAVTTYVVVSAAAVMLNVNDISFCIVAVSVTV